jgi:hypothetical protein
MQHPPAADLVPGDVEPLSLARARTAGRIIAAAAQAATDWTATLGLHIVEQWPAGRQRHPLMTCRGAR